jgi:type II secretory pathway component GspD/PulD (secretin)
MKAIRLGLALLIAAPWSALAAPEADAGSRAAWDTYLSSIGVQAEKTVSPAQYEAIVQKLVPLPGITRKIRESSTRPIRLNDWIHILRGLGLEPKPGLTEPQWVALLTTAGVDVSKGYSDPLFPSALASAPGPVTTSSPTVPATSVPAVAVTTGSAIPATYAMGISTSTTNVTRVPADTVMSTQAVGAVPVAAVVVSSPAVVAISTAPAVPVVAASTVPAVAASTISVMDAQVAQSTTSLVPAAIATSTAAPTTPTAAAAPAGPATVVATNRTPDGKPKTLTLDARGMDIAEVLRIIGRQGNLNIIASPNVRASVSISLKDVDLWQALRWILEANDLAYVSEGQLLRVLTAADYEKLYGQRFDDKTIVEPLKLKFVRAAEMSKMLEPLKSRVGKILAYDYTNSLVLIDTPEALAKMKKLAESLDQGEITKIFALNYAKAEELLPKITPMITKESGDVQIDKRTNRIIVRDSADKVQRVETLVNAFDRRHRAVVIEAKIIQVALNDKTQMGVKWDYVFQELGRRSFPGRISTNFRVLPVSPDQVGVAATVDSFQDFSNILLQLLETSGKSNLLSSPRITALNNEAAKILVGTKEAFVTTTVTNPGAGANTVTAEQVNFIDVGIKLFVTPTIGEDEFITMKIRPEVSSVARTITTGQQNPIPIVQTSEAETSVITRSGETVLLAGLIEDRNERSDSRVPILGRIPILGIPFRGRTTTKAKTEIVLLLTTRIIPENGPFLTAHDLEAHQGYKPKSPL